MDTQLHCTGPTASETSPHAVSSAPEQPVSKDLLSKMQKSLCQAPPSRSHEDFSDKEMVCINSEATSLDTKGSEPLHHRKETHHRRDGRRDSVQPPSPSPSPPLGPSPSAISPATPLNPLPRKVNHPADDLPHRVCTFVDPATDLEVRETITPHLLSLGLNEDIEISKFDAGGFNQLFKVTSNNPSTQRLLFRIAINETRKDKVNSEVATMEYVRQKTTIPVPKVYAYDSSCNNPIGSPWILLEYMQAERYEKQKAKMSRAQQEAIMKQVADWSHQLRNLHFDKIGSLYLQEDGEFSIGPLVSNSLFKAWQNDVTISHGPFNTLQEYYKSQWDYEQRPKHEEDTIHDKDARPPQHIPEILAAITQATFLQNDNLVSAPACLHHVDISANNVLISTTSTAVALIDWERAHTMPSSAIVRSIPSIVERAGMPWKPDEDCGVIAAYYARMEELEPGYMRSLFSKQAVRARELHKSLQGLNRQFDIGVFRKSVEVAINGRANRKRHMGKGSMPADGL